MEGKRQIRNPNEENQVKLNKQTTAREYKRKNKNNSD